MSVTYRYVRSNSMPIPCHSPETVPSRASMMGPGQGLWISYWHVAGEDAWLRWSLPWRTSLCKWSVVPGDRQHLDQKLPAWLCPAHIPTTSVDSVGPRAENTLWAPGSIRAWPEEAGVRIKWGLAPGGEILGTFLTYFESWSLYLKRGNKENLPHRLLCEWI